MKVRIRNTFKRQGVTYHPGVQDVPDELALALGLRAVTDDPAPAAEPEVDHSGTIDFTPAPALVDEVNAEPEPVARRTRKVKGDADPE